MVQSIRSTAKCEFSEPTPEWCPPLAKNLGRYKTPKGFYDWHDSIWQYKVDAAKNFAPTIFHPGCLLTDSFATLCGPLHSSIYFQLLFGFFPDLSGKHFSFAANDNEIFINWGFFTTKGRQEILVPSFDLFGMKNGLVNYRLATFDIPTLIRALIIAYGGRNDPIFEGNMEETIWRWHVDPDFAEAQYALLQASGRAEPIA
jgi:hypothetical protein